MLVSSFLLGFEANFWQVKRHMALLYMTNNWERQKYSLLILNQMIKCQIQMLHTKNYWFNVENDKSPYCLANKCIEYQLKIWKCRNIFVIWFDKEAVIANCVSIIQDKTKMQNKSLLKISLTTWFDVIA